MPHIEAVLLTKWILDDQDNVVPDAIIDLLDCSPGNRYRDITHQPDPRQSIIHHLPIFLANVHINLPTALQFTPDPRTWPLSHTYIDDQGNTIAHNRHATLTDTQRRQLLDYITSNSALTTQDLASIFDPTDTRTDIARKLNRLFCRPLPGQAHPTSRLKHLWQDIKRPFSNTQPEGS